MRPHVRANRATTILDTTDARLPRSPNSEPPEQRHSFRAISGTGSLAIWPRSIGAQSICNEINPRRNALLTQELGFEAYHIL